MPHNFSQWLKDAMDDLIPACWSLSLGSRLTVIVQLPNNWQERRLGSCAESIMRLPGQSHVLLLPWLHHKCTADLALPIQSRVLLGPGLHHKFTTDLAGLCSGCTPRVPY